MPVSGFLISDGNGELLRLVELRSADLDCNVEKRQEVGGLSLGPIFASIWFYVYNLVSLPASYHRSI